MIQKKLFRKYFFLPYILYSSITAFIWYKTKFDLIQFIPDFSFYFTYAYKFWGSWNSDLASNIFSNINNEFYRGEWQPSPIYPVLFLSPLNILGSKIAFALEGYFIGLGSIYFLDKILNEFNSQINQKVKYFSLIAFSLSPILLTNTIALSTNGVWGFLLILAICFSDNFLIRTLALSFAFFCLSF